MSDPVTDWTSFAAWADLRRNDQRDFCPFWNEPLTPETRFLYYSTTAPLPCAAFAGLYSACPNWRILASQLRHDILPECYGIYLCRREWARSDDPMTAEEIFRGALEAEVCWCDELPLMQAVLIEVDKALAAADEAAGWPHLVEACRIFNHDWRTSGWLFELKIFAALQDLMADLGYFKNGAYLVDDPDDPDDAGLLAQHCFQDPEANRKLRRYLAEFVRL
ncbi:MAG: hypothetical protein KatS3mg004_0175 [Bryobacteraceae bacterium]|nr:MAG: hypothetical protein KatS3mg004_0175 [Bryobacteraceae bacterium]